MAQGKKILDAVLTGSIEWEKAREAAYNMTRNLQGEVNEIFEQKDSYSPIAWINICRQLKIVTDGMIVMRMVAEGKTNKQITESTGIFTGSIAAYKAWNTMYSRSIAKQQARRVALKGRNDKEKEKDAEFLRSCGIAIDVQRGEA
jgi:uncharacterized protein YerC